jgi:hypothetical protein
MYKKIFSILVPILIIFSVSAYPFTQQINFQGRLTSSDATPISDSKTVSFKLFDASSVGTEKGSYTTTINPDKNGAFSVLLNFNPSSFDGSDRYLEIQVVGDSAMTPRQLITAVPYAYRAITAESLSGGASGLYVLKTGDIMSGNLNMNGKATVEALAGNISTIGDLSVNGNVGIGTAAPGANKLEVVGGPIKATGGLIIETRDSEPTAPATGQIWLITTP